MKYLKIIECLVMALSLMVVVQLVYFGVSVASRSERGLHAMCLSVVLVQKYIERSGEWPKSWKDLESVSDVEVGMFVWPRDSVEIQKDVEINFHVTISDVASQESDVFDAIKPRVPAYRSYKGYVYSLIETARKMERETIKGIVCPSPMSLDCRNEEEAGPTGGNKGDKGKGNIEGELKGRKGSKGDILLY